MSFVPCRVPMRCPSRSGTVGDEKLEQLKVMATVHGIMMGQRSRRSLSRSLGTDLGPAPSTGYFLAGDGAGMSKISLHRSCWSWVEWTDLERVPILRIDQSCSSGLGGPRAWPRVSGAAGGGYQFTIFVSSRWEVRPRRFRGSNFPLRESVSHSLPRRNR